MKAVVKTESGTGHIMYQEHSMPELDADKVLIKVAAAGICGTDLKIRSGDFGCNPPVILGHEYSGVVEAVGESVTAFKPGDRVISETAGAVCGRCEYCMSGQYLMCENRLSIGYGMDGAMGEYISVREEIVHKIPEGISLNEAALCEPAAVAFHAVFDFVNVQPFHTVLVTGPGTIGQLVAQMVKSTGANVILTGTERDAFRLNVAESLGMETVMSDRVDIIQYVSEKTEGAMADYAFDCSGAGAAISQAMQCLKRNATMVQVGLTKETISITYGIIPMKQIKIQGAFGHVNSSWSGVLKMMKQGQLDVAPLITHEYVLDEWKPAFDQAENLDCIKVLLHP